MFDKCPRTFSSLQLWYSCNVLWTNCSLCVNWIWLECFQLSHDVLVIVLHPVLLAMSSEGEVLAAESIRHGCLGVILTFVQQILELFLIPARKIVAVEYLKQLRLSRMLKVTKDKDGLLAHTQATIQRTGRCFL